MERERILRTVKLAHELGAKTAILSGENPAALVVDYARTHNCSKVLLGRSGRVPVLPWAKGLAQRVAALAPDVDLIEIGHSQAATAPSPAADVSSADVDDPRRDVKRLRFLWALAACAFTTLLATALLPYFDLANIVMLFLLTVVLVALKFGRGPAVVAAFVSVAAFDFFCVPPRMSFAVSDAQYLLTFAVMLAVALIIGQMTAGLRYQARIASYREERARSLYEFARDLSSLLQTDQVVDTAARVIAQTFRADVAVLVPDEHERVAVRNDGGAGLAIEVGAAQWAYDKMQPAGLGTDTLSGSAFLYLPLRAPMRTRGVLAIKPENRRCPPGARADAAARHVCRPRRDRARTGPLRRGGPAGADPDGVRAAAQFAPLRAVARPAHTARRSDRIG